MRVGAIGRIGFFVSLGILAGIGLVGMPALILGPAHTTMVPKSNGSNSTSSFGASAVTGSTSPTFQIRGGNSSNTQQIPAGDQPASLGSLAGLVSLVIVPATAMSLVGSLFVARRSRRSSPRIQSDQSENSPHRSKMLSTL